MNNILIFSQFSKAIYSNRSKLVLLLVMALNKQKMVLWRELYFKFHTKNR